MLGYTVSMLSTISDMNYLAEPQLKALRPFTSEDIDFKGTADDVRRIAEQLSDD